jgi:nucleoside-diphosphate-sugar epimerase
LGPRNSLPLASRRVAVTGAGGFIGSHLQPLLVAAGAAVEPVAASTPGSLCGFDSVVHLGYRWPSAHGFWRRLREELRTNLLDTVRLLEAATEGGVEQVCFASSTRVYAPTAQGATEAGPTGAEVTPYALAKLEQEACVRRWARLTGGRATVLRLATVYGPGETVDRAIPNFIRAVLAGRPPVVDGAGRAPYEPVFVEDVVEAVACALERRANGTFNIGTGVGRAPRDLAARVIRLCGADCQVVENHAAADRGGAVCDVSRAAAELGFRAQTPLDSGLRREIEWLRGADLRRSA